MKNLKEKISEMENTNSFSSKREITLSLMEVTQDNFCRYALKLLKTLKEGKVSSEAFDYYVNEFERYCKEEKISTIV